jgi:hypothetical protein
MDSAAALAMTPKFERCALIRRATEFSIYNSVLVGWLNGIQLKDTLTQRAAIDGRLEIRHTSLATPRGMLTLSSSPSTGNIPGFDVTAWYTTGGWGNLGNTPRQSLDVGLTAAAFNLNATNNPVPTSGSELATAGTAFDGRLSGDGFFTNVSYRGAFDPSLPMSQQWTAGWTNFDPQNYDPETANSITYTARAPWNMVSVPVVPASFNASTLFPTANGTMFRYDTSIPDYVAAATLSNGPGYWANYTSAQANTITGSVLLTTSTTAAQPGFVLIGSVTQPVPTSAISVSAGTLGSTVFRFDNTIQDYVSTTTVMPGEAHWVTVTAPCTITITDPTPGPPPRGLDRTSR